MAFAALTIDINAKLANLEQGLQKTSAQLDGFAAQANRAAAGLATAFGAIAGAVAFDAVISKLGATVDRMADLDDAAESTGASVESLSSLLNTLAPTGVTLDQITDAAGKLSRAMAGADEESSKAAEAFKAIGVATRDSSGNLRAVDDVLVDLAKALAGYEDGTNKVAIAQAIFGKTGSSLLPMLKDLATRQREAATVTTEQAAAAEALANSWREIGVAGEKLLQTLAGPIVTKLAAITTAFDDAKRAGLGFFDAFGASTLPDSSVTSQIDTQRRAIESLTKARQVEADIRANNPGMQDDGVLSSIDSEIAKRKKVVDFLQGRANVLDKTRVQGLASGDPEIARLLRGQSGGQAPRLSGGADDKKEGRPDRIYAELDARIMQSIADEKLREEAEAAKALAAELDRAADAALRRIADVDRAESDAQTAIERDVEAIRDAIDPTRALYRELERVRDLAAAGILPQDVGNARQAQILSKVDEVLSPVPDKIKEADDAARQLGLTFSSAFEDAVIGGKNLSEVLKGLGQDLLRMFIRKSITEPLAASAAKLLPSILGFADGGDPPVGVPSLVGERGPELFVPKTRGTIIPNGQFGGGGVTVMQSITYGGNDRAGALALAQQVQYSTMRAISDARERGAMA